MSDDLVKSLEWSCRDPVTHEPIDDGDYSNATVSEVKQAAAEITRLRARVAELEAVLDFYACIDHYQTHNAVAPNVIQNDRGVKARVILGLGKK